MTASFTHEANKPAAQLAAERKADEQWMRDHARVDSLTPVPARYYRPGVELSPAVGSAH
jgi:hypothetical protein